MTIRHYIKPGYLTPLATLCIALQLSGCGGLDDEAGTVTFTLGTGSASISWSVPVLREDDTELQLSEIDGFHVFYGTEAGDYQREIDFKSDGTINGGVTVEDLSIGTTYYFVVTTYDTEGRESLYSPEVEITI